jgi:ElaB/YqjD/DUF883 family membrane-anchored ribosome-binding protein
MADQSQNNDLIQKGLAELEALKVEVEKAVKTASEEAREGWKKLQPHLQRAEQLAAEKASGVAQNVGESAGEMIEDVRAKLEDLRKRMRR